MEWGEYKLGDLFEKLNLRFLKSNFDKEKDVSKQKNIEFDLPLVNAKDGDNGIMYYGRSKDFEIAEMTIDIVNDGAVSTGNVYAQPKKTGILYNAYLIKTKFTINEKLLLFFTGTIKKSIKHKYGYENKAGWEKVKHEKIQLPTTNGQIDFEFMEDFIAELEAQRIAELEAYLLATGLKDYTLTTREEKVLKDFENGKFKYGEFEIEKLFKIGRGNISNQKKLIKDNSGIVFIAQNDNNNGFVDIVKLENHKQFKGNSLIVGRQTGIVYYQEKDFITTDGVLVLSAKKDFIKNRNIGLFFTNTLTKKMFSFGYNNTVSAEKLNKITMTLPTLNNKPDYKTMETLISAIQKLVIKEVVIYIEKKIKATKSIVEK